MQPPQIAEQASAGPADRLPDIGPEIRRSLGTRVTGELVGRFGAQRGSGIGWKG